MTCSPSERSSVTEPDGDCKADAVQDSTGQSKMRSPWVSASWAPAARYHASLIIDVPGSPAGVEDDGGLVPTEAAQTECALKACDLPPRDRDHGDPTDRALVVGVARILGRRRREGSDPIRIAVRR